MIAGARRLVELATSSSSGLDDPQLRHRPVAGTQVFTLGLGGPILGKGDPSQAQLLAAAWGINLPVAEWAIRSHARRRPHSP